MSETANMRARRIGETLAPYHGSLDPAPVTKLSISLPTDLVEVVRAAAAETGSTVSATIAAALRRTFADVEQALLDAALDLDHDENLGWAAATGPTNVALLADLEW
ncbi:MAG: hypothetical protein ABIZ72_08340 [Candidatus Limnocylindrales bacterium]